YGNYSVTCYKAAFNCVELCFALPNRVKAGVLTHLVPAMTPIPAVCRWLLNSYNQRNFHFLLAFYWKVTIKDDNID
ncbi:MAG: hypothetical protein KAI69_08240, partial [Deltaproteobacteria bacterium]|nr:hypothetical protein [Deltaproteobacteria bacterium]